ncbi:MAG: bifunctional heptose 7-phosphate kinase/heptose 1-phosphate adenyltransferase [Pyrinomonadaceae bacterium]
MSSISEHIRSSFSGKRIAVIGDIVADQFLNGTISRVSREAPVFILKHDATETRPGGAANAAANVASLGGDPVLVGMVGKDDAGSLLIQSLNDLGVNTDLIVSDPSLTTTAKLRVLAGQPYAIRQQVIRIDYENSVQIGEKLRSRFLENVSSAIATADTVIVSDYNYGVAEAGMIQAICELAGKRSIPVIADSRWRLTNFSGCTSATPNQEEAEAILGRSFELSDAETLRAQLDLDSIVVTLGNKGMAFAESGRSAIAIPPVGSTQPVDVTGAGDTVIAAFALGVASNLGTFESAVVANHAGGIVVMKRGTAVASIDELVASISAADLGSTNAAAIEA